MSQPRDDRQDDLFRLSLEAIINLRHPLVRLAAEINWDFLAKRFSSVCRVGPGQPPLPTRLVAGLLILKHMHNLSDEVLCDRWVETSQPPMHVSNSSTFEGSTPRPVAPPSQMGSNQLRTLPVAG